MNVFHTPETTMTPEEAEALVRRYLERTPESPLGPSVADVAEALRLPPEEVARMLAEVRAAPRTKPRRKTTRRERRVWLLSGVCALAVGGLGLAAMSAAHVGPFHRRRGPLPPSPPRSSDDLEVFVDGSDLGTLVPDPRLGPPSDVIADSASKWMKENASVYTTPQSYSYESAQKAIQAAKAGRWEAIQGVAIKTFELRKPGDAGPFMRWARAVVPVYDGDDLLVADAVRRERDRRIAEAVKTALKGIP